ncbi:MAG: non-ribosomal peptide synthetase [Caldilineaceae bacterium]|nr:non-ribosomal peptide synthetase [Caldilineaceae bacterium]
MSDEKTAVEAQHAIRDRHRHPAGGWMEFPLAATEQSIGARFEAQVASDPTRPAVTSAGASYTYGELNAFANRIAHAILARRGKTEKPAAVAILLNNDAPMLAAMLGVLKSGAPYVPFDPAFPQERLAYYWADAGATLLLTDGDHYADAVALAGDETQVIDIHAFGTDLPTENPPITVFPDAIAYIYYTSGSTGTPKSVYNSHRNLLHHIRRNTNIFCVVPEDRFICLKSFSFAGALKDIYGALLNGASIHLYPLKQQGITRLAEWLIEHEITIYNSVATVFRQLADTLANRTELTFPHLRIIYFGGERIKLSDFDAFHAHFGAHSLLVLGLGSTETGPVTAFYQDGQTQVTSDTVPLGYAAEETEILILDEAGSPLPPGQAGEIAIQSAYLALGYWHNKALTNEKFVPVVATNGQRETRRYQTGDIGYLDENGCLYHLGRRDFQLKIRGFRVEPAEIEEALRKHPAIQLAAVVGKTLHSGEQGLVAYYVAVDGALPTVSELRAMLSTHLPDYMIPAVFVPLESLPVNAFGKLDLKALAAPERSRPHLVQPYVAPQTPAQERLAALWSALLGIDEIGIYDDFLEIGGSSILMMQLLTRTEQAFDCQVPIPEFLAEPTIVNLATLAQLTPA